MSTFGRILRHHAIHYLFSLLPLTSSLARRKRLFGLWALVTTFLFFNLRLLASFSLGLLGSLSLRLFDRLRHLYRLFDCLRFGCGRLSFNLGLLFFAWFYLLLYSFFLFYYCCYTWFAFFKVFRCLFSSFFYLLTIFLNCLCSLLTFLDCLFNCFGCWFNCLL